MFYTYKNCKILIDNNEIITQSVSLSIINTSEAVYLADDKESFSNILAGGVGGSIQITYNLSGEDPLKRFLHNERQAITGSFGGLIFNSGWLKSYSVRGEPNQNIVVSAEINFFDALSGSFEPVYELANTSLILNSADIEVEDIYGNIVQIDGTITKFAYNFTSSFEPVYLADDVIPSRMVFGPKEITCEIGVEEINGQMSLTGEIAGLNLKFWNPDSSDFIDSYNVSGIIIQRELTTSIGNRIESNLVIRQNNTTEAPILFGFRPLSGNYGDTIYVYGKNLGETIGIRFIGASAEDFDIIDDFTVRTQVPTGAVFGPLILSNFGGASATTQNFTLLSPNITINSFTRTGAFDSTINISGLNFISIDSVCFSGLNTKISGKFTVINNSVIQAIIPTGAAYGTISIGSSARGTTGYSLFYFEPIPKITGFTPLSGIVGDVILISGDGFSGARNVQFNFVSASSFTVLNNQLIQATVPDGNIKGNISVSGQTTVGYFNSVFIPVVKVTGINALFGEVGKGVNVIGQNFYTSLLEESELGSNRYIISFNGATGIFDRTSSSTLTGQVPIGATSGPVSVLAPDGGAYATNVNFSVRKGIPSIEAISPPSGSYQNYLLVKGQNFFNLNSVYVSKDNISISVPFEVGILGDYISFLVPNITGRYNLAINTANGTASGSNLFYAYGSGIISGFSPGSGVAGTVVAITGKGIYPGSRVFINSSDGIECSIVSNSFNEDYSSIRFVLPANLPTSDVFVIYNNFGYLTGVGSTGLIGGSNLYDTGILLQSDDTFWYRMYLSQQDDLVTVAVDTTPHSPGGGDLGYVNLLGPDSNVYKLSLTSYIDENSILSVSALLDSSTGPTSTLGLSLGSDNYSISVVIEESVALLGTSFENPGGSGTLSGTFFTGRFVFIPSPRITGFTPPSGEFGQTITVSGSGFTNVTGIKLGEQYASIFSIVNSGKLTFKIPESANSNYIRAISTGGYGDSLTKLLVYTPLIVVSGVDTNSGYYGDLITLSGSRMNTAYAIRFSGNGSVISLDSSNFVSIDTTGLRVFVPDGALSGKITITNERGDSQSPNNFIINPTPSILGITSGGFYGQIIFISGSDFTNCDFLFSGPTGNYVRSLSTRLIGDTGAYLTIPKEITTGPIFISGRGRVFGGTATDFVPWPTISEFFTSEDRITGQVVQFAAFNAFNFNSGFIGITGASGIFNLAGGTFSGDFQHLTGSWVTNSSTGYAIISGILGTGFAGTGTVFLIPTQYSPTVTNIKQSIFYPFITGFDSPDVLNIEQPQPLITRFSPTRGNSTLTVEIVGEDFLRTTDVFFKLGVTSVAATIIPPILQNSIVVVPPANPGIASGIVVVQTQFDIGQSQDYFIFIESPIISGAAPNQGGIGDIIRITGKNLSSVTGLYFGNYLAPFSTGTFQGISVLSGIVPDVPLALPATVNLVVANEIGASMITSGFTILSSPQTFGLVGFTITSGVPATGTLVLPSDGNVIFTNGTYSGVSNVKAGAVYYAISSGNTSFLFSPQITGRGSITGFSLNPFETVTIIGVSGGSNPMITLNN
jgi:hypothetical protein